MKSFRMMMRPDNYSKGYWGNLAIRKEERFYIQLNWDAVANKGVIEFREETTHNLLGHMPLVIESAWIDNMYLKDIVDRHDKEVHG